MKMMVVAALLASGSAVEGFCAPPELVANVSLLLATFYEVDCIHIFRTEDPPLAEVERIHDTWKKLAEANSKVTTGVYAFSQYLERKELESHEKGKKRYRKVNCYRSLNIMWDDEGSERGYAEFSQRYSLRDVVWVLYSDSLALSFFGGARVGFEDVIIIAAVKGEESVLLHEVYGVSSESAPKVLSLGEWTKAGGLNVSDRPMYERRSDLEGVVLKIASLEDPPASYKESGRWQGFLINLWNEIQSLINCTSVEVEAEDFVGTKTDNGSWSGLVDMATRNEIDVIVAEIVIDKDRARVLDFFHPISKSRFQIYTRHLGYGWQWASVLKPFDASVWAAAACWLLAATAVWLFVHSVCVFHGLGSMDFEGFPAINSFFFVLQALCQQGYHSQPKSYACRLLFFVTYAASAVLIPSYSAFLVSSLSQKTLLRSFDSLEEMVKDGTYRLIVKENTAQHALFLYSIRRNLSDKFADAYEKLVKPVPEKMKKLELSESLKALCRLDNYAVMGLEEIVESRMQRWDAPDCPVVHLAHPVSTVYLTMAARKGNPYSGLINHQLGKLIDAGVVDRLRRQKFPLGRGTALFEETVAEVGMRQTISVFLFIASFAGLSVLLLLLEMGWLGCKAHWSARKRKKRGREARRRLDVEMRVRRFSRGQPRAGQAPLPDFFPFD